MYLAEAKREFISSSIPYGDQLFDGDYSSASVVLYKAVLLFTNFEERMGSNPNFTVLTEQQE